MAYGARYISHYQIETSHAVDNISEIANNIFKTYYPDLLNNVDFAVEHQLSNEDFFKLCSTYLFDMGKQTYPPPLK